ncbi:MAG: copper amine oxidase N-terminal domain-containing protein [Bacillota bacterium]|nr:copper amine oxidase N-terminal domain-containing protein [Bacillota bacterium]
MRRTWIAAAAAAVLLVATPALATDSATYKGYPVAQVKVNGQTVTSDVPAIVVDGRTMVPLRFVTQALGGQVEWDQATRTASIQLAPTSNPADPLFFLQVNMRLALTDAETCSATASTDTLKQAMAKLLVIRDGLSRFSPSHPLYAAALEEALAVGDLQDFCGLYAQAQAVRSQGMDPTPIQNDAQAALRISMWHFQVADGLAAQAGAGHFLGPQDQAMNPWQ